MYKLDAIVLYMVVKTFKKIRLHKILLDNKIIFTKKSILSIKKTLPTFTA